MKLPLQNTQMVQREWWMYGQNGCGDYFMQQGATVVLYK